LCISGVNCVSLEPTHASRLEPVDQYALRERQSGSIRHSPESTKLTGNGAR